MSPEPVKRKISAILSADVVGYSKLMEADEMQTVQTMESYRKTVASLIDQHDGYVIDSPGDNILSDFGSVVDSVQCAVEIQHVIKAKNAVLPEARRMEFRVGINLGDVIKEGDRLYGDGINIASRIEGLADAGGICISGGAYEQIKSKLSLGYEELGEQSLKNIGDPVRVYRIPLGAGDSIGVVKSGVDRRWRNVAIAALAVVAIGAVVSLVPKQISTPPSPQESTYAPESKAVVSLAEKPSIAVLPFENMSNDPEQEYFVDGIVEEIIARLSINPMLTVIARNSTFAYKGKGTNIQDVGRELGARYIVEGSVRKAGNEIRITAQLLDATTGTHLWAESYDRELTNIFTIQDDIAQQIAAHLSAEYGAAESARVRRIPTDDLTAYDSVLRGIESVRQATREGIIQARPYLETAIEIDPEYADAYLYLGRSYYLESVHGGDDVPAALEKAFDLLRTAISLDSDSASSYAQLSEVYLVTGRHEQALVEAERSIELDPNNAGAYYSAALVFLNTGVFGKAATMVKVAMRLDPYHHASHESLLMGAYSGLGQFESAVEAGKKALSRDPNWIWANSMLADVYLTQWGLQQTQDPQVLNRVLELAQKLIRLRESYSEGYRISCAYYLANRQYEKAISEAEKGVSRLPGYWGSGILLQYATALACVGRHEDFLAQLEEYRKVTKGIPSGYEGWIYRLSGRQEDAVKMYRKALTEPGSMSDAYSNRIALTILHSIMGNEDEAKAEAAEILKLVPNFSVETWGERNSMQDRDQVARDMAALRKAGLK